jgi:hypothetical protein
MRSDDRARQAQEALKPHSDAFRAALSTALERVRTQLVSQSATANERVNRIVGELGPFAAGRIDAARFTTFALEDRAVDPTALRALDLVATTLRELSARGDGLFRTEVPEGGDVVQRIEDALGEIGRAFGAARVVELARVGGYRPTEHRRLLVALPFGEWTAGERRMAPPLVVTLCGADLDTPALARLLDGSARIVLVVRDNAAPAPCARLVGFGAYVAQAASLAVAEQALQGLVASAGPGLVALLPEGSAEFVYDPARPAAQRLSITSQPDKAPKKGIGVWSPAQLAAELDALRALAAAPQPAGADGAPAAPAPPTAADPADKLAAWLLSQVSV